MQSVHKPNTIIILIMMMFCISGIGIQQSFAQQTKIDSLYSILQTSKEDTNKVNILYYLSDAHKDEGQPYKAIEYAKQGLDLANDIEFKDGVNICLNTLGIAYYNLGILDSALMCFEKRLEIVTELNDLFGIAGSYDNIGIINLHYGNNDKALEQRTKANEIYASLNDKSHLASGYIWIGNIYKEQGKYPISLEFYLKALKIHEDENDEENIAIAFINISSIYRYMKQYDKAKNYAFEAISIFKKVNNWDGVGISNYRLALICSEESDTENTFKYLNEAKTIFLKTENKYFQTLVDQFLGTCYRDIGNNNLAFNYFKTALKSAQEIGDNTLISNCYQNIGAIYYDKKHYFKALEYIQNSERILKEIKDNRALMDLTQDIIEIYSHLYKPDSVSKYFQYYRQLYDTIFNEQNSKSIAEMQTKYETEKKEKELEISIFKIQEQKAKVGLLTGLLMVLLSSSVVIYLLQRKKYQKNILLAKTAIEKNKLQDSETKCRIRNAISDDTAKEILEKLSFEIETQKCYLDQELTINTLALKINTNREYLSQIINSTFGKNFNEFINYYRVQESIEILKKIELGELKNWTMDIVAEKSGFKYPSTYNPAFKAVMKMSPTEFKKALKKM